jgi:hypothetical protein
MIVRNPYKENTHACLIVTFLMIKGYLRRFCLLKPQLLSFIEG